MNPTLTNIWFKTMDGFEDTITCLATEADRNSLDAALQALKDSGDLSDFTVATVSPYIFTEAVEQVSESLERFNITLPILKGICIACRSPFDLGHECDRAANG